MYPRIFTASRIRIARGVVRYNVRNSDETHRAATPGIWTQYVTLTCVAGNVDGETLIFFFSFKVARTAP